MQARIENNNNTYGIAVCHPQLHTTPFLTSSQTSPLGLPIWTINPNIQEVEDEHLTPDRLPRHSGPGTSLLRLDHIERCSNIHSAEQPELQLTASSVGQQNNQRLVNRPQRDLILEAHPVQRLAKQIDCMTGGRSQQIIQQPSLVDRDEQKTIQTEAQTDDSLVSTTHRSRILSAEPFCTSRTTTTRYGTDSPQERDTAGTPRSLLLPHLDRSAGSTRTVVDLSVRAHCSPVALAVPSLRSISRFVPSEAPSAHPIDASRVLPVPPLIRQIEPPAYLETGLNQNLEPQDTGQGRITTARPDSGNQVS